MISRSIFLALLLLILSLSAISQTPIMSFNIRYDNPGDKENQWVFRKAEVTGMIEHYTPSVIGIQEALYHQVSYLDSSLVEYNYVGVGRDDGKNKGEYAAIFYNIQDVELIRSQTFWLSESPEKVSVGWDASMERIVTFAEFKEKDSGKQLFVFNAHFDHIGEEARINSSKLILTLIKEKGLENERLIVMGDLNAIPNEEPIAILNSVLNDSFDISSTQHFGPIGTFNAFDPCLELKKRIDYIFIENLIVLKHIHVDDRRKNSLCLSDHLPVLIEIE